jgi:acyl-coenzyme A synthetase/AMP-(fatty) acid ligase
MNAAEHLLANGRDEKVAIEAGDDRITYAELRDVVARAGSAWRELGLGPDDRVLVFAPDSIAWVTAYLGAIWGGGVAVGLNSRLFERELSVILAESGARFVFCDPGSVALLDRLSEGISPRPQLVTTGDFHARLRLVSPSAPVDRDDEDMALWVYSSGTTGQPKGVIHAQRMVLPATEFAEQVLGLDADARIFATSKLFFAYALGNSLCAGLALGATLVLDEEWPTAERVAEVVARHRPSVLFSVPTLYLKMLHAGVAARLEGVSTFASAGEALPVTVRRAWREATGVAPVDCYGASETIFLMLYGGDESGLLTASPRVELRPRDPTPPPGTPHRLWLRHPSVARGYWQRPEAERDAFWEGWFSPGDLFRAHDDSRWEVCGRDDDMLKISGQWVSVIEVEHLLASACGDAVQELAAVGFENDDGLSSIAAFAVAVAGAEAEAERRLQAAVAGLPKLKRPRELRWVSDLPRTATGKLQRRKLRELYLGQP